MTQNTESPETPGGFNPKAVDRYRDLMWNLGPVKIG
jgi:hypothetical protein